METQKPKTGRPRLERKKRLLTIRFDQDVIDRFEADGPGFTTRINAVLADWVKNQPKVDRPTK
jgi:uncharacterized protein (DUF4415 family)